MHDSYLNTCLHPGLPVRGWNLLNFFLPPSSCKLPSMKGVGGNSYWHVFCPLLLHSELWMVENHLDQNGLICSLFKKQTQMFVSVKTNLWLYAIQHKSFRVRERCPGCNLNGFCTYFSHYQITFLIWFLFGLLCPCIPCLALLSPSFFFCYYLSQLLSFQFSHILTSIDFSEICCHLKQHPSFFESTNQASCWLIPLFSSSFWMHSQVRLHCD